MSILCAFFLYKITLEIFYYQLIARNKILVASVTIIALK